MKTKVRLIAIIVILAGCAHAFSQSQQPPPSQAQKPVRLSKLSDRLYQVLDGLPANGGLYIGDNAVLLIDSKMDKLSVDQTLAALKQVTDKPLKYLVNTHSDGDHVNGNRYMPQEVTFISQENCRKEFFLPGRDGKASEWSKPELAGFVPSITFRDKMEIYLGTKKIELWYFGAGHTTGDAVVYFPEEKTAFIGDQFFTGRPQLIHSFKGGNSFEHVKTLEKMLAILDVTTICSGHSDPVDRKGILDHIAEMKAMQAKIRGMIGEGKGLDDIKKTFKQDEGGLVESIYNEIKKGPAK